MGKFWGKANNIIECLEKNPPGLLAWSLCFTGIVAIRLFLDEFVAQEGPFTLSNPTEIHNLLFFLLNALLLWLLLAALIGGNPLRLGKIILWAGLFFIFPPIIDMLKTGGSVFWSPYLFSGPGELGAQFKSFFGHLPSGMLYFGTRIIAAASLFFFGLLVFIRTKNYAKALLGILGTYAVLFFMASLPSWLALIYYFFRGSEKIDSVSGVNVIQFVGTPKLIFGGESPGLWHAVSHNLNLLYFSLLGALLAVLFFWGARGKFLAVARNARFPQLIVHGGLFLTGMGVGLWIYPQNLNVNIFSLLAVLDLLAAIGLAWIASVIFNDIADFSIDGISNQERPLQKKIFSTGEYRQLGVFFVSLSLLGGFIVAPKFAALLAIYQFLAWIYSAEPMRLKKFPLIATFLSSAALLIIFFIGFSLISGSGNLHGLPWRIILLLLFSFTLVLPLKDFKDVKGDKSHGIWTIPVLFGEEKGRLISAVGIFVPFMLSVFLLNEFKLFWWALLFGVISFLVIVNRKISPRRIFWWALAAVSVYGLILVKIIFFSHVPY